MTYQFHDISTEAKLKQQGILLAELTEKSRVSTLEAREGLGILHPAGRVHELRKRGYTIETEMTFRFDAEGRPHRVGVYIYKSIKMVAA